MTKEYSYRRWQTLAGSVIAILFGAIPILCFVIPGFIKGENTRFSLSAIAGYLFIIGIPTLLLSAGIWLLRSWLINRVNKLEISDKGVRYGAKSHTWEQIKWLSWHCCERGKPTLFYQKKGFSVDYNLMVTDPLTQDEIESLFDVLEQEIVPIHKELQIG